MTDTVGFIRKLPHQLVDAFAATLEETKLADLILHVVDAHAPEEELEQMTARGRRRARRRSAPASRRACSSSTRPTCSTRTAATSWRSATPRACSSRPSRARGWTELGEAIAASFERSLTDVELLVPFSEGQTLSELHDVAGDLEREDTAEGVRVTARLPAVVAERYDRYSSNGDG